MKAIFLFTAVFLLLQSCLAQEAQVAVFRHELRWTDETRFPNYFVSAPVRDSVFNDTRIELMNYLKVPDVKLPKEVEYRIINGFGKQNVDMQGDIPGHPPVIGIFSFITRATSGYAIFWKLKLVIRQDNKIILEKEIAHELEYFNVSGYVSPQLWMSPEEFRVTFKRMLDEALGVIPPNGEKIVLGLQEDAQEQARFLVTLRENEHLADSLVPQPVRCLLKINGAWKSAGNFSARLDNGNETGSDFYFKQGGNFQWPQPSFSSVLASLFSETTGINIEYDQKVTNQINGRLTFADGQQVGLKLKWMEIATRSTLSDDVSSRITAPLTAELYDEKVQAGYFLYTRTEETTVTDKTRVKFNAFTGHQKENTLGSEWIHRIKGSIYNKPIFAEYNETHGIIKVQSGDEVLGIMVVQNCNPDSRSIGNVSLSKNKLIMASSGRTIGKPSLKDEKKLEWYPVYFPASATNDSRKICIETLVCLFFGIGNM